MAQIRFYSKSNNDTDSSCPIMYRFVEAEGTRMLLIVTELRVRDNSQGFF